MTANHGPDCAGLMRKTGLENSNVQKQRTCTIEQAVPTRSFKRRKSICISHQTQPHIESKHMHRAGACLTWSRRRPWSELGWSGAGPKGLTWRPVVRVRSKGWATATVRSKSVVKPCPAPRPTLRHESALPQSERNMWPPCMRASPD